MRVLVACEFSGVVRTAFHERGHDVTSCDLMPSAGGPGRHVVGDVSPLFKEPWDLVIAHPPCTYLCFSGLRWVGLGKRNVGRLIEMEGALAFFRECLGANSPRVCVENPRMSGLALSRLKVSPTQMVQPWMFGHAESKALYFWLKGLPPLRPTRVLPRPASGRWSNQSPCGANKLRYRSQWMTGLKRSISYPGMAEAMAEQWSEEQEQQQL